MVDEHTVRFEIGKTAARDSLAEVGKATTVPDYAGYGSESARAEWTRGWDSIIDGPEGEAWRAKARAERMEDCPTHGIERRRCGCASVAREEKRDDLDEERLDTIVKSLDAIDRMALSQCGHFNGPQMEPGEDTFTASLPFVAQARERILMAVEGLRRSLRLATDAARRAEQDEEEALKEERLRLVGLANAVLDGPREDVAGRLDDGRLLARAVLDSKVLR